jgi:hypothetical protein
MQRVRGASGDEIEVLPLVVTSRTFPARPSSLPNIRDFIRRGLTQNPFSDEELRALVERLTEMLLDVAGPTGMIQVSLRIFPEYAEIDVLPTTLDADVDVTRPVPLNGVPERVERPAAAAGTAAVTRGLTTIPAARAVTAAGATPGHLAAGSAPVAQPVAVCFSDWLAGALKREGMTMEAAARQLSVSVKTVSRWVGGSTEPRLRDLSRIREIFGEMPFP